MCVWKQVKNNIVRVFTKFVREGKATIKFKDPAHDIAISKVREPNFNPQCSSLKLSFIRTYEIDCR